MDRVVGLELGEFRFKLLVKNLLDNASHYSSNNAPAIKDKFDGAKRGGSVKYPRLRQWH
jgi:hypothetical protein